MRAFVPVVSVVVVILAVGALIGHVSALFEDQVGSYDWRQQYIGKPVFSHIDANSKKVFIASDQHVLAALNLKTGAILWRKIFEKNDKGHIDYVLWSAKEIVLVSGYGTRVQGFSYAYGFANWEYTLFEDNTVGETQQQQHKPTHVAGLTSKQSKDVHYLTDGRQLCYVGSKEKSCVDVSFDEGFEFEALLETDQSVFLVARRGTEVQKIQFNLMLTAMLAKTSGALTHDNSLNIVDKCIQSADPSNELACLASGKSSAYLLAGPIKANSALTFDAPLALPEQLQQLLADQQQDIRLVWSSRKMLLFVHTRSLAKDEHHKFTLYLVKRAVQSDAGSSTTSLLKKIELVNHFDIVENTFLVYSKYLSTNLAFAVFDLKSVQERNDLLVNANIASSSSSNNNDQDAPKSIIHVKFHLDESGAKTKSKADGGVSAGGGLTALCMFGDYSLWAFGGSGVRYFAREEALAYITSVETIDFPLLHLQEELEDEFGGTGPRDNLVKVFYKRVRMQLIQLREFLVVDLYEKLTALLHTTSASIAGGGGVKGGAAAKRNAATATTSSGAGAASALSAEEIGRDEFNLNKLLIVATSVGKVFGLYTGDNGRILWSFYLRHVVPFEQNKLSNEPLVPLFLQRTAAHFPFEPQCVLLAKTASASASQSSASQTRVFFFNPISGAPSKEQPRDGLVLDYEVKQAFLFQQANSQHLKPLVLFDSEHRLHAMPAGSIEIESSPEDKLAKPMFVYTTETSSSAESSTGLSSLVGYSFKLNANANVTDDDETVWSSHEVWRMNFDDEQVVAIGAKLPNDRIHSHGKVLGDRSVLYKYLNPNMIGVVTRGLDTQKMPFLNVYVVDTVTGSVIYSFSHKRCRAPVRIVHSENWFFYSYYNTKYRRYEVTTVELFEGSQQHNSTHFSSLDDVKPLVFTKSYIVQKSFDAMQVTITEKGISTKDVIVASQFGTIMEIPWILIDSRRPLKMTDIEREENLLPYMPEIPLNYEFSLNYYNYVYNIRGIVTSPTGLESTGLVFAYGLDLYFTRIFPSKTFDILREDFDYFFITTLMVGLLLGTVLSKKLASSSNLKKAWK